MVFRAAQEYRFETKSLWHFNVGVNLPVRRLTVITTASSVQHATRIRCNASGTILKTSDILALLLTEFVTDRTRS